MKSAENLLRALTRAMLGNSKLEPIIQVETIRSVNHIEVDIRPLNPAPMIGSGGTMKFAIQAMLAGTLHPDCWSLEFRNSTSRMESPRLKDIKPDIGPMKAVVDAAVNHWRAMGFEASATVETSETAVLAILVMEDHLANAQRGAFSRIARAIGKANGYRCTCIIEKPAYR